MAERQSSRASESAGPVSSFSQYACDRARLHPQIVFESGQFSSLLSMVGAGMGVSIVPEMAIVKSSPCRYVHIADEQAAGTIGTVVLRGRSLTRAHHAFLSHLRAAVPVRL